MRPKKIISVLLVAVISVGSLTACGDGSSSKKYGKGEIFYADSFDFTLHEVVLMSEYDTSTRTGYGVVFLTKKAEFPVRISGSSYGSLVDSSLVDMTLFDGDRIFKSANIIFAASDDVPGFEGTAIFIFQVDSRWDFPKNGSFVYDAKSENSLTFEIDLSELTFSK